MTVTINRNREIMAEKVMLFLAETKKQAHERRLTVCKTCRYHDNHMSMCNYYCDTGEIRPCVPSKCKETGIWKKGKRKKDPTQISLTKNDRVFIP